MGLSVLIRARWYKFIAPATHRVVSNYPVILNSIPMIRQMIEMGILGNTLTAQINSVDDCVLRYIGAMENKEKQVRKQLGNPMIWFRTGVEHLLAAPVFFLIWFGITGAQAIETVFSKRLFKIFTFIVSLVGIISSIITLLLGWQQAWNLFTEAAHSFL